MQWRDLLMTRMEENPGLVEHPVEFRGAQAADPIAIDRDRAADLGVSLQTVGRTLETVLGSRIVTTFIERDREYNVILQGRAEDRATPADLDSIYVRSDRTGELDPAVESRDSSPRVAGATQPQPFRPAARDHDLALRSQPGYTLGEALDLRRRG